MTVPNVDESYGACPIKRKRRTKAAIQDIRLAIYDVIENDPPMTVRQVFYQLVTRGVIEKTEERYQETVIRLMVGMRLAGDLAINQAVTKAIELGLLAAESAS